MDNKLSDSNRLVHNSLVRYDSRSQLRWPLRRRIRRGDGRDGRVRGFFVNGSIRAMKNNNRSLRRLKVKVQHQGLLILYNFRHQALA